MPQASDSERAALSDWLSTAKGFDSSRQSLHDEVGAGAQVLTMGVIAAEPALAMMELRSEAQSSIPIELATLRSLIYASPDAELQYFAVFGAAVDGQVLVDGRDGIVTCWVYPAGIGVVPASDVSR